MRQSLLRIEHAMFVKIVQVIQVMVDLQVKGRWSCQKMFCHKRLLQSFSCRIIYTSRVVGHEASTGLLNERRHFKCSMLFLYMKRKKCFKGHITCKVLVFLPCLKEQRDLVEGNINPQRPTTLKLLKLGCWSTFHS